MARHSTRTAPFPSSLVSSPDGYVDLHLHSTHSDGLFSPEELVSAAIERQLRAIALTDHDTVSGIQPTIAAATRHGLSCLAGIELSTYTPEYGELHILGYAIDPENPELLKVLARLQTIREDRIQHMLSRLRTLGIEISWQTVRDFASHALVIGRPHLARAMVQAGVVASVNEAFSRYLGNDKPGFVPKVGLSYEDAIQAILNAGGIPVYAHPGLEAKDELIPRLLDFGLLGLEVFHSSHSWQDVCRYRELVARYDLIATGGSDCHGGHNGQAPLIGTIPVPYSLFENLCAKAEQMAGRG